VVVTRGSWICTWLICGKRERRTLKNAGYQFFSEIFPFVPVAATAIGLELGLLDTVALRHGKQTVTVGCAHLL